MNRSGPEWAGVDRALRASDLQSPPTLQNTPTLFFYQGSTSRGFSLLQLFLTEVHLINVFFTLLQNLFFVTVLWRSNTSHIFITVFPLVAAPEQKSEDCLSEKKIRRRKVFREQRGARSCEQSLSKGRESRLDSKYNPLLVQNNRPVSQNQERRAAPSFQTTVCSLLAAVSRMIPEAES